MLKILDIWLYKTFEEQSLYSYASKGSMNMLTLKPIYDYYVWLRVEVTA